MCSGVPLHLNSEYFRGVLQEDVIFLLSIGWVSFSYSFHFLKLITVSQTPQNKRQEYVNAFNKGTQRNSCMFNCRHFCSIAESEV